MTSLTFGACAPSAESSTRDLGDLPAGKADANIAIPFTLEPGEEIRFTFFFTGPLHVSVSQAAQPTVAAGLTVEQGSETYSDGPSGSPRLTIPSASRQRYTVIVENEGVGTLDATLSLGGGALTTAIIGKVFAPNGALPLANVTVYVPASTPPPFTTGATCDRCSGELPGGAIVATTTDDTGAFRLEGVPANAPFPSSLPPANGGGRSRSNR
ncbi:MAG: hypothetical protein AB7O24_33005 [Kofleriaceae bacterium]